MNLFRRAVDGLITGADKELAAAGPVRMFGGARVRALSGADGKEESTAQKHGGKGCESFQSGCLLLMYCGGKFRCSISGQNGIPESSHLVIPSRAGMNFIYFPSVIESPTGMILTDTPLLIMPAWQNHRRAKYETDESACQEVP
jgi:hypothetical protein